MSESQKICVMTGTTGYVGSILKFKFKAEGWHVRELSRRSSSAVDAVTEDVVPFQLGDSPSEQVFLNADVFIHCAYDFKTSQPSEIDQINVNGSVKLFESAQKAGVSRMIFISSMSAFKECASLYGKAKLKIEKAILPTGVLVIRPGLVYGSSLSGIFGNLFRLIQKLPILPLIGNGKQPMFLVHDGDLARSVHWIATSPLDQVPSLISVAHPAPVTFRIILETLAALVGKKIFFIPVPYSLVLGGLKFIEKLGFKPRLRSDSLIGMVQSNPHIDFVPLNRAGLNPRSFSIENLKRSA